MEIQDSVCIVTGGSSGLGRAALLALAKRGARVANFDIGSPGSQSADPRQLFVQVDITDERNVIDAIEQVVTKFGGVHACVNCAGTIQASPVMSERGVFPIDLFRRTIEVNLTGTFLVLTRAAEQMAKNSPGPDGERGVIVNTSSIAAMDGSSSAAYAASKGGIISMNLCIARDLAKYGIRINAIAPGMMNTEMFANLPPERTSQLIEQTVFPKRLGSPEEFGAMVCHLIENRLINATTIRLDAGARV